MWRPLSIDLGEPGTVVNSIAPAPVSLGHGEAGIRVGKTVKSVLNQALALSDDPALRARLAGHAGDACIAAGLFGMTDRGDHTVIIYQDSLTGVGGGAQTVTDGQDAYGATMMAGCGLPDVETHEASDPVVFLWRRIPVNNGGPGQLRGGQGIDRAYLVRDLEVAAGFAATFNALAPVPGCGGGLSPAAATHTVARSTAGLAAFAAHASGLEDALGGQVEQVGIKDGSFVVRRGDVVRAIGGGGAGLGDPLFRAADLVARDVHDGYINARHAREAYGVVLDERGEVDVAVTADSRRAIRERRIGCAPGRDAAPPESPGFTLQRGDGPGGPCWICGSCGQQLCAIGEDWRSVGTVPVEEDLTARFARLGMQVRPRRDGAPLRVREVYCPTCASCLGSEVVVPGFETAVPQLY
jgi:N-methylhydantoinase B